MVVKTFMLQNDSYGFVWIIRVYLLCALIVPFACKLDFSKLHTKIGIVVTYVMYELCCYFEIGVHAKLIGQTVFYAIPFGMILFWGLCYKDFSQKTRLFNVIVFSFLFIVGETLYLIQYGEYCFVQPYKYPPRHMYIIHALMYISILMFWEKQFEKIGRNALITFVSRSSLWIYLWHIAVLFVVKYFFASAFWGVKFIIVVSFSILIVFFQNKVIDFIERKREIPVLKFFRG